MEVDNALALSVHPPIVPPVDVILPVEATLNTGVCPPNSIVPLDKSILPSATPLSSTLALLIVPVVIALPLIAVVLKEPLAPSLRVEPLNVTNPLNPIA